MKNSNNISIIKMKIDILGTEYTIKKCKLNSKHLENKYDGTTDYSTRKIYVSDELEGREYREVMRHEIIHAFLLESGLYTEMSHPGIGHDEQMIDWMAIQYPKIRKVFHELHIDY